MKRTLLRTHARGVSLVEVLIVVAIMSLLAAGIGIAAYNHYEDTKRTHAANTARTLRQLVQTYWLTHPEGECPTIGDLTKAGTIDEDSSAVDSWGTPWTITCNGTHVTVRSAGPDRKPASEDDIRVPKKELDD